MDNLKRAQAYHKSRLGQILVNRGYVTEEKISEAIYIQKKTGDKLGKVLLQKKWVSRWQLRRALSNQTRMRFAASLALALLSPLDSVLAASSQQATIAKDQQARLLSTLENSLPKGENINQLSYDVEKAKADIRTTGEVSLKVLCSVGELRIDHLRLRKSAVGNMDTLELTDIDLSHMKISVRNVYRGRRGQTGDPASLGA